MHSFHPSPQPMPTCFRREASWRCQQRLQHQSRRRCQRRKQRQRRSAHLPTPLLPQLLSSPAGLWVGAMIVSFRDDEWRRRRRNGRQAGRVRRRQQEPEQAAGARQRQRFQPVSLCSAPVCCCSQSRALAQPRTHITHARTDTQTGRERERTRTDAAARCGRRDAATQRE